MGGTGKRAIKWLWCGGITLTTGSKVVLLTTHAHGRGKLSKVGSNNTTVGVVLAPVVSSPVADTLVLGSGVVPAIATLHINMKFQDSEK